jgi:type 2 lantibiotic biosynthesis protein LanM
MTYFSEEEEIAFVNQTKTIKEKSQLYSSDTRIDSKYLEEWRSVRSLLNDKYFEQMLNTEEMTLHEFSFTLQPAQNEKLGEIDWFEKFKSIINSFDNDRVPFTNDISIIYLPFLIFAKGKVKETIDALDNLQVSEEVINSFLEVIGMEMFTVFGKLIALDLEVYKQTHKLENETSEGRFKEFLEKNYSSRDELIKFYSKYPVATRVATERVYYLNKNFSQMLQRIDKDHEILKENFQVKSFNLSAIQLSTGDSHQQGNSVAILAFENQKLVYKPRNMEVSESFEHFLKWSCKNSNLLNLKFPKGVYNEDYSYNEFIQKKNCADNKEVERFYVRYGYLIAICYFLGINDLHMENIIAEGEYPVIIDIETMFQPVLQFESETVFSKITRDLQLDSVMNSCLLPQNLNVGIKKQVELSALNGREVKTGTKVFVPQNVNTDQFRYEQQEAYFRGGNNIPDTNQDEEVDFQEYRLKILEGFQDFTDLVMNKRQDFIQKLEIFKGKKVRILTKGTERYAMMIRYASHPNYNSEMKYRERLMMNTWAYPYKDKRIVSSEVRDLIFNDIPIFFSYTDSTDIIDSQNKVYENYFKNSGLQEAVKRIQTFNKSSFEEQYKIMLLALGVSDSYLNEKVGFIKLSPKVRAYDLTREAEDIAQSLIKDMVIFDDEVSFANLAVNDEKHWHLEACDESFYGGLSGIGLFFLNLYQKTHKKEYFNYYEKLLRTSINQSKAQPFKGGFDGWLSPIFPLLVEYKSFGTCVDEKFVDFTVKKLNELSREKIEKLKQTDYISGLSGILRLIEKINIIFEDKEISPQVVESIVATLKERIKGNHEITELVGVAHGLSGVALSFLSSTTSEKELIKELLSKEMELSIKKENEFKWCWGIPGMIQARIEILRVFQDEEIEEQLNYLIKKFEKLIKKIPLNDSLCHGTGGILMTLENLYNYSSEEKWKEKINQIYANIKENSLSKGYMIRNLLETDIKGLFDGRTGVGKACLNEFPNFMLLNLE